MLPGLTVAKVRAAVEADSTKLESLGYSVKSLYVDDGKTQKWALANALATGGYDCIITAREAVEPQSGPTR